MHENANDAVQPGQHAVDSAAIRELLGMMKVTQGNLNQTFRTLSEQTTQFSALGPSQDMAEAQMEGLRSRLQLQAQTQQGRVDDIKKMVRDDFKRQVEMELKDEIRFLVRTELEKQVKQEIEAQGSLYLGPLAEQVGASRGQLEQVKRAVQDSDARLANSLLKPGFDNLTDLKVVLKSDGTKSPVYPANISSLLSYDQAKVKQLLTDFDLHYQGAREKDINRFMAHIGVSLEQFELVL